MPAAVGVYAKLGLELQAPPGIVVPSEYSYWYSGSGQPGERVPDVVIVAVSPRQIAVGVSCASALIAQTVAQTGMSWRSRTTASRWHRTADGASLHSSTMNASST